MFGLIELLILLFVLLFVLIVFIVEASQSASNSPRQSNKKHSFSGLSKEEIEYDYLQRQQEAQDEEDYYLQQMNDE